MVQTGLVCININFRTKPIAISCTVMRTVLINRVRSNPRPNAKEMPPFIKISDEASAKSKKDKLI
ncbi:MAG: hypothetical protein DHS20C07_01130 [Methyloligella sp.]|nr:MAG: hypothetical protein DHS20C07_01130 [Methyloligella sp.]